MLDQTVRISGTDPSNPKTPRQIVERLEAVRAGLANMHEEVGRLQAFAGGIRDVLHYDQSYPLKRADMIAGDVTATIKMLREDIERLTEQTTGVVNRVADCGVNLNGKFTWRPARSR